MSTQVTVHRMVTTTTTSAFLINVGYLKTFPGILKIFQIILGCVAIGIIGHYIPWTRTAEYMIPELFFLLIATACLITTTLLLMSCLCSIATASIIPKTLFVSFRLLVSDAHTPTNTHTNTNSYLYVFIYMYISLTNWHVKDSSNTTLSCCFSDATLGHVTVATDI
ncbi:uncharacterized protein LOC134768514 [Penaeus indicus]|uniref:uncharacterized protein LOC134768514 n=1 Tax=Penaeus indicus TaxID=29960 RepID=UPI00300C8816